MKRFVVLLIGLALLASACGSDQTNSTDQTYTLTVNYDLSIEEMVEAGDYDWVDTNTNVNSTNFPSTRDDVDVVEVYLIELEDFDFRNLGLYGVLDELDKQGLRPATIEELLAFGFTYPKLQQRFAVVALGSIWVDRFDVHDVPILWSDERGRIIGLGSELDGWASSARLLAVRK